MGNCLSKSKYCLLWQCPKLLWLEMNRPELKAPDSSRDARMEMGNIVGDLAMGLFGEFTETTVLKEDGRPDISAMLEKTRQCIADGVGNICEAAFSYNGHYCAVDILRKENGGYAIYEVKSSTHEKEVYGVDIAYQKYILENCGVRVTGTYLVCLDNKYIRGADLDIQKLFKVVDMSDWVTMEYPRVPDRIREGEMVLSMKDEPDRDIGTHCADPYECPFFAHCSAHLPENNVLDLFATLEPGLKRYEQGVVDFGDAQRILKLTDKQKRQIRHTLTKCGDEINKSGVQEFLDTLRYPLYFLDFETMQLAIPLYERSKPYDQIPFQYSLHYIETPGGELKHKEFLAESGPDPRRNLAEALCRDIPVNSCVIVYNQKFERGRLNELALLYDDLAPHLLNIRSNIRDLLIPFEKGCYYNRAMGGSLSIKSVLPALFPGDPELDYHNLEGVHNGGEAMTIFPQIKDMPPEEQENARRSLLEYCKLDTYAMVKIWEKLCQAAE